jgi:hypothetical protein
MVFTALLLIPVVSNAALVWSGCLTITSVSNELAYDNGVFLAFSGGGISGCGAGTAGGVVFLVGQEGVTSSNINSILATALAAQVSGKGVMILYDNSSGACNSQIISIGGYSSQCP